MFANNFHILTILFLNFEFIYLQKFGEIIDYVWDEVTPALVVNFKTRKEAENAMNKGRNFQDLLLTATWYNSGQQMSMR